jgi:Leucine-rich repeat (LRR) protein
MAREKFDSVDIIYEGRLRGNQLICSGVDLVAEEAQLLWSSEQIKGVSWLDLADNKLADQGVKELTKCESLINVQYLNLNNNQITDEGLKSLAMSPYLKNLKHLHLKDNLIEGEGIVALFQSQTLDHLQKFQINDGWSCRKREGWRYKSRV